jgi:hypothetical protein
MGQTRMIRACPLHVCFTPKPGRSGAQAGMPEKGQELTYNEPRPIPTDTRSDVSSSREMMASILNKAMRRLSFAFLLLPHPFC